MVAWVGGDYSLVDRDAQTALLLSFRLITIRVTPCHGVLQERRHGTTTECLIPELPAARDRRFNYRIFQLLSGLVHSRRGGTMGYRARPSIATMSAYSPGLVDLD